MATISKEGTNLGEGVELTKEQMERLFDEKYGSLDGSTLLSHQEYLEHRNFQIDSGLFYFRLTQFSD